MDFLLKINEFVQGPIGDLLVQLRTGGIQFPPMPALPDITLTPQLTLPENIQVGDLGSTFGDFSPAELSSGDNGSSNFLSELSTGDNGSSNFLSELSSGDNQGSTDFLDLSELSSGDNQFSTDFLGDFSQLSSGDNGSSDIADLTELSGNNGSSDILDLDFSDLLDLDLTGDLKLPDIPQSV